jgi:glycosyltransferase involved in cell wall biosynthesis
MDMPNFALAKHLADRGTSVTVVAHRIASELAIHPNVDFHRVPKPLDSYFLGAPLLDRFARRVARKSAELAARILVNGGNCQVGDVNWVHYVHAAYEPQLAGSPGFRAKGHVARLLDLKRERAALQMARIAIVNSERTRRDLITHLDIDDARIRTVYYGIDAERFAPPSVTRREQLRARFGWPNRPQVAFIGALGDRRKGFDTLYQAWASLCAQQSWDCDLVVVGRGAELPAWKARAQASRLAQRIRFLGFRDDVPDVLAACDALVSPTRYEAYGLGVQEALCTGLPALVSANAGIAERYPAVLAGLLLHDVESASELESRLKDWRDQADHLREETLKLSSSLRQRTWDTMAGEISEILE